MSVIMQSICSSIDAGFEIAGSLGLGRAWLCFLSQFPGSVMFGVAFAHLSSDENVAGCKPGWVLSPGKRISLGVFLSLLVQSVPGCEICSPTPFLLHLFGTFWETLLQFHPIHMDWDWLDLQTAPPEEKVWISRRGPLSLDAQRAIELVPLLPCVGSGLVAASQRQIRCHSYNIHTGKDWKGLECIFDVSVLTSCKVFSCWVLKNEPRTFDVDTTHMNTVWIHMTCMTYMSVIVSHPLSMSKRRSFAKERPATQGLADKDHAKASETWDDLGLPKNMLPHWSIGPLVHWLIIIFPYFPNGDLEGIPWYSPFLDRPTWQTLAEYPRKSHQIRFEMTPGWWQEDAGPWWSLGRQQNGYQMLSVGSFIDLYSIIYG